MIIRTGGRVVGVVILTPFLFGGLSDITMCMYSYKMDINENILLGVRTLEL